MDSTERLLRALIKALGYEVEEVNIVDEENYQKHIYDCESLGVHKREMLDVSMFTSIDYKVTKKDTTPSNYEVVEQELKNIEIGSVWLDHCPTGEQ